MKNSTYSSNNKSKSADVTGKELTKLLYEVLHGYKPKNMLDRFDVDLIDTTLKIKIEAQLTRQKHNWVYERKLKWAKPGDLLFHWNLSDRKNIKCYVFEMSDMLNAKWNKIVRTKDDEFLLKTRYYTPKVNADFPGKELNLFLSDYDDAVRYGLDLMKFFNENVVIGSPMKDIKDQNELAIDLDDTDMPMQIYQFSGSEIKVFCDLYNALKNAVDKNCYIASKYMDLDQEFRLVKLCNSYY
jgi:hypothetical protein